MSTVYSDIIFDEAIEYILTFLLGDDRDEVYYGNDIFHDEHLIILRSDFWDAGIYGTKKSIPELPLKMLPGTDNTPFLYGSSDIERKEGKIILHADIIASAYYMLTRYEEIIFPEKRDRFGRYLAAYSILFQNGYGLRPLADEYREYLFDLLMEIDGKDRQCKQGFSKIWLTHDLDAPFYFHRFDNVVRQWIKNFINPSSRINNCLKKYVSGENDPYDTFDRIFELDNEVKRADSKTEVVYFIITAKNHVWNAYRNIGSQKYKRLMQRISKNGDGFGIHLSLEAGKNPDRIADEVKRMPVSCGVLRSRNHYLRWIDTECVYKMTDSGISEDFTLGYADHLGFRVGTCHPYMYIEPHSGKVTDLRIIPMQIMEKNFDEGYMGSGYDEAVRLSKEVIRQVFRYGGHINLLWHNTSYNQSFFDDLYRECCRYISELSAECSES